MRATWQEKYSGMPGIRVCVPRLRGAAGLSAAALMGKGDPDCRSLASFSFKVLLLLKNIFSLTKMQFLESSQLFCFSSMWGLCPHWESFLQVPLVSFTCKKGCTALVCRVLMNCSLLENKATDSFHSSLVMIHIFKSGDKNW